jgi:hypothetical protein
MNEKLLELLADYVNLEREHATGPFDVRELDTPRHKAYALLKAELDELEVKAANWDTVEKLPELFSREFPCGIMGCGEWINLLVDNDGLWHVGHGCEDEPCQPYTGRMKTPGEALQAIAAGMQREDDSDAADMAALTDALGHYDREE